MWYHVNDDLRIKSLYYNFLPSWWHRNYGLVFGTDIVFQPDYRVELHRYMERTVYERYPDLHIGSLAPEPSVIMPDFGNTITAAAAGCEVVYPVDNYPWNHHLAPDAIPSLRVPSDLSDVFPYCEIAAQVRQLNLKLGKDAKPVWNSRGVLNDAVLIGGTQFFVQFEDDENESRNLLDYSYGMLVSVIKHNHQLFDYHGMVMLTNCTVMMVSAQTYYDKLLHFDESIYAQASGYDQEFGVHHCGGFERYIASYRQIPHISFLEIGWGSDARLVLERFPEAYVQYILSASFVSTASREQVRVKVNELLDSTRGYWDRFGLSMPDIEYGTPDDNLNEIYICCKSMT